MKILASDFDGTLNRGGVSDYDKSAISAWQEAGNLFGIVTGRDFNGIWYEVVKHNLNVDFLGAYNGGVIYDGNGENIICETSTSPEMAGDLLQYLRDQNANYAELCVLKKKYQVFPERDDRSMLTGEILKSLEFVTMINTYIDPFERAVSCVAEIAERFGRDFNPLLNGCCIDIPPAGMNKGVGVQKYADAVIKSEKYAGQNIVFGERDILTVGDQLNDLDMIIPFFGCAVENAVDDVKSAAKMIYKSVGDLIYDNI